MEPDRPITEEPRGRADLDPETVRPGSPPPPEAPAAVATMWYWLGSVGLIVLVALFALFYWGRSDVRETEQTAPTTGISEEARPTGSELDRKPGGTSTEPRFNSPDDEIKYRTR